MTDQTRGLTTHISPQLLVKEGGRDLLFLKSKIGASCLSMAAQEGHLEVVEVSVCVGVGCSGMSRACGVLPRGI